MQPFPFLKRRFEERLDDDGAGMIEEHCYRTKAVFDAFDRRIDSRLIRNIGNPVVGNAADADLWRARGLNRESLELAQRVGNPLFEALARSSAV